MGVLVGVYVGCVCEVGCMWGVGEVVVVVCVCVMGGSDRFEVGQALILPS